MSIPHVFVELTSYPLRASFSTARQQQTPLDPIALQAPQMRGRRANDVDPIPNAPALIPAYAAPSLGVSCQRGAESVIARCSRSAALLFLGAIFGV